MSETETEWVLPDARAQRVIQAWEALLGQVDTALLLSGREGAHPGWLVLTLVLSLARTEPALLAEATTVLERAGFPLFVRDMLDQALDLLRTALEPVDGD